MKKMKKFRTVLLFAFLLVQAVNSVTAQRAKPRKPDYFPLRVGDSWKYRSTTNNSEYTTKVVGAEKQTDGTMTYALETLAGIKIHRWYSKTDGWVLLHREAYPEHEALQVKHEPAKQVLKDPLAKGVRWNWSGFGITSAEMGESNQVTGPEAVTVPAGRFRTMKIVSKVSEGASVKTVTYWYADGIGLNKYEVDMGQVSYGFELIDYSFRKVAPRK